MYEAGGGHYVPQNVADVRIRANFGQKTGGIRANSSDFFFFFFFFFFFSFPPCLLFCREYLWDHYVPLSDTRIHLGRAGQKKSVRVFLGPYFAKY